MKKLSLVLFIVSLAFIFNSVACTASSLEDVENDASRGIQKAQCELGCALWSGTFGNIAEENYRSIPRNVNKACNLLKQGVDSDTHGEPTESTYSFIVDALNALGSYYEVEAADMAQAKLYYKRSADLFVKFDGEFAGTIAGRNYMRLVAEE
jgi:hypothetical protein